MWGNGQSCITIEFILLYTRVKMSFTLWIIFSVCLYLKKKKKKKKKKFCSYEGFIYYFFHGF